MLLHPDKNDAPDAELKFRQLVGIYEVLKDETRRIRYFYWTMMTLIRLPNMDILLILQV